MQLTLTIISYHRLTPGQETTKVFGPGGGTIGRAAENTWALPDPERLVSGKHAEIQFSNGKFFVIDHSTNGLYVTDPGHPTAAPIGKGNRVELRHGQQITLGEYELEVAIKAAPLASPNDETDPFASLYQKTEDLDPLAFLDAPLERPNIEASVPPPPKVTSVDLGKNHDFFQPAQPMIPDDWDDLLGNIAPPARPTVASPTAPPPIAAAASSSVNVVVIPEPAMPSSVATPTPATPANVPPPSAAVTGTPDEQGLREFLLGLGLTLDHIPPASRNDLLRTAGAMLRMTIDNLLEVLRARAAIKSELRAEQTMIRSAENNPLKFSAGVDDALFNLFSKRLPGFLAPADAVQEAMKDIKYHQIALMAGVEAAQRALLDALNPAQFAEASPSGGSLLDRLAPSGKKAASWDQFVERHAEFAKTTETQSHMLFREAFEHAYTTQLAQLKRP
jgi:type VI secretion system protein